LAQSLVVSTTSPTMALLLEGEDHKLLAEPKQALLCLTIVNFNCFITPAPVTHTVTVIKT